jgi:hypothetical protein
VNLEVYFERTSLGSGQAEEFEDMNIAGLALAREAGRAMISFGRDQKVAGDRYPRGLGRVRIENTSATDPAAVRLRVWAVLQCYAGRLGVEEQERPRRGARAVRSIEMGSAGLNALTRKV